MLQCRASLLHKRHKRHKRFFGLVVWVGAPSAGSGIQLGGWRAGRPRPKIREQRTRQALTPKMLMPPKDSRAEVQELLARGIISERRATGCATMAGTASTRRARGARARPRCAAPRRHRGPGAAADSDPRIRGLVIGALFAETSADVPGAAPRALCSRSLPQRRRSTPAHAESVSDPEPPRRARPNLQTARRAAAQGR